MGQIQLEIFDPNALSADQLLDNLDDEIRGDQRLWHTLLAELVDVVTDHLETRKALPLEAALEDAQDLILVISHYLGGRNVYLPRDDRIKRALRDSAIYKAFDGNNHLELARKAKLTTAQIYNIVERQRRLRQDRNQLELPL